MSYGEAQAPCRPTPASKVALPVGKIETTYDLTIDLTVAKATGEMTAKDFYEWYTTYYEGTVTSLILWDVSEANLAEISTEDIQDDVIRTNQLSEHVRNGGKTAVFVPQDTLEFGLSRMLEAFYAIEDAHFEVKVFSNIDEAKQWLGV